MKALLVILLAACAGAAESEKSPSPLDQPAQPFSAQKQPIEQALFLVGRAYQLPVVVEPGISGDVSLDLPGGGTVRQLLDALTYPRDLFWQELDGRIVVKPQQTVFYELQSPGNTRTSTSATSIALSSSSASAAGAATTTPGTTGTSPPSGGGQSNITVTEKNENPFWELLKSDFQSFALPAEKITINPNSGIVIVTASPRRQAFYREYVAITNERLSRQVDIEAQILEVTINADHKLGVDYALAAARLGDARFTGGNVTTDVTSVGPNPLRPNTVTAGFQVGKVGLLVRALQEQGEVRSVAKPQVRVMNNQTAYLVVGREQGFFTLSATQQITAATAVVPTGTESAVYNKETLTFGTVFTVTASIPTRDTTILDVKPERSTLVRIDLSPDSRQQTPVTDVQRAGTRLLLRDGETTVLAGLSNSTEGTQTRGAPGLMKVPALGRLFRTDARTKTRTELVIIITARISAPGPR